MDDTMLEGLKVSVCQMKVVPGRPDLNGTYILNQIRKAAERGVDLLVFPEMALPGYFIGDMPEDESFVRDVMRWNQRIVQATEGLDLAVVWGSIYAIFDQKGQDGRTLKWNAGLVAQSGELVSSKALPVAIKTLHPNYRVFADERHFFSLRVLAEQQSVALDASVFVEDYLFPFPIRVRGQVINLGVILCEDMWHADYALNPTKALVDNGAQLIVNLSCSPWTWQKNRKRHSVVRELLELCGVPFVYVNNTGVQDTGKNWIIFDGSSTIYNAKGEIVFAVDPFASGAYDYRCDSSSPALEGGGGDDTKEMYRALEAVVRGAFGILPPSGRKVVVGLSGGIDSATTCALFAQVLGPENVIAINMPSEYNGQETKDIAQAIAENLGIEYLVRPIGGIVEAIVTQSGTKVDSLSYENIQARARMEILAAVAQDRGAVYSANGNKVELAFGYGTLYGDIAGFIAPLADLVKREVYQLADYLNEEVFGRVVIPRACFDIAPMAELKRDHKDPFDYGSLTRRGYHDEMVRAFTEFRRNPEWFLEKYLETGASGCPALEQELQLEPGTLKRLFPTGRDFVRDLEEKWAWFHRSYFKRVQSPPIPIVSRRAFGTDLREAFVSPHLTIRYHDLKQRLLSQPENRQERVVIYGGSFNPPGVHHRQIAERLVQVFDRVIVVPCGLRPDKASSGSVSSEHRVAMVQLAFGGIPRVRIDLFDLDGGTYTPAYRLQEIYQAEFPDAQIFHAVGEDIFAGGREGQSEIHRVWKQGERVWSTFRFAVLARPGYGAEKSDRPPQYQMVELGRLIGSSSMIRDRLSKGEDLEDLMDPEVEAYVRSQGLYGA